MAKKKIENQPEAGNKFSIDNMKVFTGEVKAEFHKIAWPDKKHTLGSTGVVVVLVSLISCYLGAVDVILGKIIGSFLK